MKDKELIDIWKKSTMAKEELHFKNPKLLPNMEKEIAKFERRINQRDRKEIMVAAALLPFLIIGIIVADSMYDKIACSFTIAYLLWVIVALVYVKNKQPAFSISSSLKEQLIDYRSYVLRQQKLVRNVLYWYLLPIIPGAIFYWLGIDNTVLLVIAITFMAIVFSYVYNLNKRAAAENYPPLLDELDKAIDTFEEKT